MIAREPIKRSPFLTAMTNELPFILADGAGGWRLCSLVKLRSALDADEVFHRDLVTQASCLFGQAGFQPALIPAGKLPVRRTARMAVLRRKHSMSRFCRGRCQRPVWNVGKQTAQSACASHSEAATGRLILVPNRAGPGNMFLDCLWIARVCDFSRAGDGDFQCLAYRNLGVSCAGGGDCGGSGLETAG